MHDASKPDVHGLEAEGYQQRRLLHGRGIPVLDDHAAQDWDPARADWAP